MTISYRWLASYFTDPLPLTEEIARLLTRHAYEVERVSGDILEIDILPNRAHDSLSHRGVARELSLILDLPLRDERRREAHRGKFSSSDFIQLSVENSLLVPRALKRIVRGVSVGPSPAWLVERLAAVGQRSINAIVDATNFITYDIGQPVHAFDYEKLAGRAPKTVSIRPAREGERITLLDGTEHTLNPSVFVIADENGPLDVAGIKGGAASGIDEKTTTLILSACAFDGPTIRKAARKLNLRTDASVRFQHGISPELAGEAMERLVALVTELAGGEASDDTLDHYPSPKAPPEITVSKETLDRVLGTKVPEAVMENILGRLVSRGRFTFEKSRADTYRVTPPSERLDLSIPEDIIEEIGRLFSYDTITAILPASPQKPPAVSASYFYAEWLRDFLTAKGFSEVYNYSFVKGAPKETSMRVANPLAEDKRYLRANLAGALQEKLVSNMRNAPLLGLSEIRLFELGHVFTPEEETHLAIAAHPKGDAVVRAIGEEVCRKLGIEETSWVTIENGVLEVNFDKLVSKLPIPSSYTDAPAPEPVTAMFAPFSPYPFILRDSALWVPTGTNEETVRLALRDGLGESGRELLHRMELFDRFEKEGRISYAYHLVFQSNERTLTDTEINTVIENLTAHLEKNPDWRVR